MRVSIRVILGFTKVCTRVVGLRVYIWGVRSSLGLIGFRVSGSLFTDASGNPSLRAGAVQPPGNCTCGQQLNVLCLCAVCAYAGALHKLSS